MHCMVVIYAMYISHMCIYALHSRHLCIAWQASIHCMVGIYALHGRHLCIAWLSSMQCIVVLCESILLHSRHRCNTLVVNSHLCNAQQIVLSQHFEVPRLIVFCRMVLVWPGTIDRCPLLVSNQISDRERFIDWLLVMESTLGQYRTHATYDMSAVMTPDPMTLNNMNICITLFGELLTLMYPLRSIIRTTSFVRQQQRVRACARALFLMTFYRLICNQLQIEEKCI